MATESTITIKIAPLTAVTYAGFALLYTPTFYKLFTYGWKNADYSHGPLILLAFLWLIWKQRKFLYVVPDASFRIWPLLLLTSGLVLYTIGSISSSMVAESFSIVPVFLGMTGFLLGREALMIALFPGLFLIFLIPPPGFFIDMITAPLQVVVTAVSASLLKAVGYLITRDGVILRIGDYTIVVGEVCSGLRSMISLMSVGALYAWLQETSSMKKALLFASIIPISIIANIFRLIVLALVTFYLGEAAGQGFFHDFSGFLLFVIAMGSLVIVDTLIDRKRNC